MVKMKKIRTTLKNNKSVIITSVCSSILTVLVILGSLTAILAANSGSITIAGQTITKTSSTKTVQVNSEAEQSSVINAVSKANPAVVSIVITKDVPKIQQYQQNPFYYLFGGNQSEQDNSSETEQQEIGGGSGFLVSSNGYIVTNNHVVSDKTADYTVLANDGKEYEAKVLAKDSTLDVAVIKIEGENFPYLSFADSDKLKLGQTAIAIGNALAEFQNSISMGIISGLSRSITAGDQSTGKSEQLENVIQTDAAINPGNSGGPLLDINGNVIGVNVAVESSAENIGFALPGNTVKSVVDSVMNNGEIVKPYLGIRYSQINTTVKENNNLSVDYGVLVSKGSKSSELAVIPGSPADKAGIVENDIILEIDEIKLDESKSLASIIRQKEVGQKIKLKVLHRGEEKTVEATLEKAPSNL